MSTDILIRAAETLERLAPVVNAAMACEAQAADLRALADTLAPAAGDAPAGAVPQVAMVSLPAKPSRSMLLEAQAVLQEQGGNATFAQLLAIYNAFTAMTGR